MKVIYPFLNRPPQVTQSLNSNQKVHHRAGFCVLRRFYQPERAGKNDSEIEKIL
jgi:hypothetical protein